MAGRLPSEVALQTQPMERTWRLRCAALRWLVLPLWRFRFVAELASRAAPTLFASHLHRHDHHTWAWTTVRPCVPGCRSWSTVGGGRDNQGSGEYVKLVRRCLALLLLLLLLPLLLVLMMMMLMMLLLLIPLLSSCNAALHCCY